MIKCGQRGSCRFDAILVVKEVAESDFSQYGDWYFDRARFCRMHAAAAERRTYDRPGPMIPIGDAPLYVAEVARRKAERDAEEARSREANRIERQKQREARAIVDWEHLDDPWESLISEESKGIREPIVEQVVLVRQIGSNGGWDDWTLDFSQTEPGPRYVYLRKSGTLTPIAARALAEGLIKAAEIAEATNARLRTKGRESE